MYSSWVKKAIKFKDDTKFSHQIFNERHISRSFVKIEILKHIVINFRVSQDNLQKGQSYINTNSFTLVDSL